MRICVLVFSVFACELALAQPIVAPKPGPPGSRLDPNWVKLMKWRCIGPASMGGRIVDLEVAPHDPNTFYLATASGGLFKTSNNGTTFQPLFQKENTVSIGDVALAPSDKNRIYIGTGEHNPRNSVSYGDGVYRSDDGGKSWKNIGLKKSFQIGRIAVHPENPDIVYVGALGRLWGTNKERGLYKTVDGGKTWKKILYVDEKTGCTEVQMHPKDPDTLLVAMYERQRNRYAQGDPAKRWGPGSGLYKTTDGGKTWKKLTEGLPTRPMGRIGIKYWETDPQIVFSIIETDKIGTGPKGVAMAYMGITGGQRVPNARIGGVTNNGPAQKAGLAGGDVIVQMDKKKIESYNGLVASIRSHKPGDTVTVTYERDGKKNKTQLTFGKRPQGNANPYSSYLGGQRANVHVQQGKDGYQTGGLFKSEDGGETWTRMNSINPRPFYYSQVHVDPRDFNYVYILGVQFHYSTDGGKSFKTLRARLHPDHHALWINPKDGRNLRLGCDGGYYSSYDRGRTWNFHNVMAIGQFYDVGIDNTLSYRVYGGLQDNGSWGGPSFKRGRSGPGNGDWFRVGGGDGFVCRVSPENKNLVYYESQYGRMGRVDLGTGVRARIAPTPERNLRFRFNWKTPFALSHHNARIFYAAGNYVFRSLNRGTNLRRISPRITRTAQGTATALAESPLNPDLVYVGTDDGFLWVTTDNGRNWQNITKNVGLPAHFQVSSIECSRFQAGRCYVAFDGHRDNNDAPHVYVTEDSGKTWKSLNATLPKFGSTRTLREDAVNSDLLYCGTEFAVFASLDRGRHWIKINANLPTVAIHEIAVHPMLPEIVVGTHGRSVWIADITPLRQTLARTNLQEPQLFAPAPGVRWSGALSESRSGNHYYLGENPAFGTAVWYYVPKKAKRVTLQIRDAGGAVIHRLTGRPDAGLHRSQWDLRRQRTSTNRVGGSAAPGNYVAVLNVDGVEMRKQFRVLPDPDYPNGLLTEELEQFEKKQRPKYDE